MDRLKPRVSQWDSFCFSSRDTLSLCASCVLFGTLVLTNFCSYSLRKFIITLGWYAIARMTCVTPACLSASIWCKIIGLFAKSTRGLGTDKVSGLRRVPNPPKRLNAFMTVNSMRLSTWLEQTLPTVQHTSEAPSEFFFEWDACPLSSPSVRRLGVWSPGRVVKVPTSRAALHSSHSDGFCPLKPSLALLPFQ